MGTRRISRVRWLVALAALTLTGTVAAVALADNVQNDITTSVGGTKTTTIAQGGEVTVGYWIEASGSGGFPGCDATVASPATVHLSVPAAVTADKTSVTLTACGSGNAQNVKFSSNTVGTHRISVSQVVDNSGDYNLEPGKFDLVVTAVSTPTDTTKPTITINTPEDGAQFVLGEEVFADYECDDQGGSGLLSCEGDVPDGDPIDTASIGAKSFTVNAQDNAGNSDSLTHYYDVTYDWSGFFRPIDNLPTLNKAKAGSAIPVKFSLAGDQGLSIMAAGYPKSQSILCESNANVDGDTDTVNAGQSSLSYDSTTDTYTYVWKSEKNWTGCRQLVVRLIDGTEHRANFKFSK